MEKRETRGSDLTIPRALIVKFSAIGDCVMSVPVASAIRAKYPEAFIAWAVDPRCAAVLDTKKLIDLRFDIPREAWKKSKMSPIGQLRHYARLRQYHFDFGLDLQGHSKTAICLRLAKPNRRIAIQATDFLSGWLNPVANLTKAHAVERNIEALRTFGDYPETPQFAMPTHSEAEESLQAKLESRSNFISIHVGAGAEEKKWPLDRWASVAAALQASGHEIVFLGGPGEPAPIVEGVCDLSQKLTLEEMIVAVKMSKLHLAADTGSGHIAAAYQVPVVSVFGNTNPERFRPYTKCGIALREGYEPTATQVSDVLEAAQRFL